MFQITDNGSNDEILRQTDDYGQAIFWARHYVTNCGMTGTTVWLGDSWTVVYCTSAN